MVVERIGQGGRHRYTDPSGAVFAAVPGKAARPVYPFGPPMKDGQPALYQCPVSAIPEEVFDLLDLWWNCRAMGLPPVPGAFTDQPLMVRRSFPVFEREYLHVLRERADQGQASAAALAVGAVMKGLAGR